MDALGIIVGSLVLMWAAGWLLAKFDPPPSQERRRQWRMIAWGGAIWKGKR